MLKTLAALFLAASAILTSAGNACAASAQFFATGDYYMRSGIEDDIDDATRDAVSSAGIATGEVMTTNGIGGRVGVRKVYSNDGFDLGGSFSYVKGPEIDSKLDTPTGNLNQNVDTFFSRIMAEVGYRLPLGDHMHLRLSGAAGVGRSRVENSGSGSGVFVASGTNGDEDKDGFVWEASPAIVFNAGKTDIELGMRYAHFQKIGETSNTPEIKWNPLGFYLGVAF